MPKALRAAQNYSHLRTHTNLHTANVPARIEIEKRPRAGSAGAGCLNQLYSTGAVAQVATGDWHCRSRSAWLGALQGSLPCQGHWHKATPVTMPA